jgi:osmotically-inducible protein OsmY
MNNIEERRMGKMISRFLIILSLMIGLGSFNSALGIDNSSGNLYTQVVEQLKFEPGVNEANITVAIRDNGIVVLGGKVGSYSEKRLAAEAVEKIATVKGVANEIEVELLLSYKRSDVDIVKAALNALKWTVLVPHENIKVAVDKGHLTLTGDVTFHYQKKRAEEAVRDLYGVISVTNKITVKPTVTPSEVKEKITKEFERNARIDARNIQVEVDGSKVTLKGSVKNFDEDREARNAVWSIPGVSMVVDQLEITW